MKVYLHPWSRDMLKTGYFDNEDRIVFVF